MKKTNLLLALVASSLVLSSCPGQQNPSETPTESSTSEPPAPDWSAAVKEHFEYYAGEVLPYIGIFATEPTAEEDTSSSGQPMVVLYDQSTTDNYSTKKAEFKSLLEGVNWEVSYETDEDGEYIYATKSSADQLHGYELYFWYGSSSGNTLQLVNNFLTNELSEATAWTAEQEALMNESIEMVLPFMKFGADLYTYNYDEFTFVMYDTYYQSLVNDYAALLSETFTLDPSTGLYVLEDIDCTISVELSYYFGNMIAATYTPKATESAAWPTAAINEFCSPTEQHIPAFELDEGASYSYYIHSGKFVIESTASDTKEEAYAAALNADVADLMVASDGAAQSWDESLNVEYADVGEYNDDYDFIVSGFKVSISVGQPVTLDSQFPITSINEFFNDSTIVVPGISYTSAHGFKCSVLTAEEQCLDEYGWFVAFGYTEEEILDAFLEDFSDVLMVLEYADNPTDAFNKFTGGFGRSSDNCWFRESYDAEKQDMVLEDITGKGSVEIYVDGNVVGMIFSAGKGEAHTRGIQVNGKTTFKGMPEAEFQIDYELRGIAGAVTFTSSNASVAMVDASGKIVIPTGAQIGDEATITLSVTYGGQTYETTVGVLVADVQDVTDTLNQTAFGLTDGDTNYADHSYTSTDSGATYSAQCAAGHGIQIRSKNNNSGIIGHAEGVAKSIEVTFDTNTAADRVVNIYASNEAFTIADMYSTTMTPVATLTYDGSTATVKYDFEAEYAYIGIRSNSGAIYLSSVDVTWEI